VFHVGWGCAFETAIEAGQNAFLSPENQPFYYCQSPGILHLLKGVGL
jgi:hypothetical protein